MGRADDLEKWLSNQPFEQRANHRPKVALLREIDDLTAQRDELLAALEAMVTAEQDRDQNWLAAVGRARARTRARAAIARAKGKQND